MLKQLDDQPCCFVEQYDHEEVFEIGSPKSLEPELLNATSGPIRDVGDGQVEVRKCGEVRHGHRRYHRCELSIGVLVPSVNLIKQLLRAHIFQYRIEVLVQVTQQLDLFVERADIQFQLASH